MEKKIKLPIALKPLFHKSSIIQATSERIQKYLQKLLGGDRVIDAIYHMPTSYTDRTNITTIADAPLGEISTLVVTILEHQTPNRRGGAYRLVVGDDSGVMDVVFFGRRPAWVVNIPVGEQRVVSGKIDEYRGKKNLSHPDSMGYTSELEQIAICEPNYPLTAGVTMWRIRQIINESLEDIPDLDEWIESSVKGKYGFSSWKESIIKAHTPTVESDIWLDSTHRKRLAYDELLASQVALALLRANFKKNNNGQQIIPSIKPQEGSYRQIYLDSLPYDLTNGQKSALKDIYENMFETKRMMRLIQGDVGSGKTLVATMAMLGAIENGFQSAFMAPTEILAQQHFEHLFKELTPLGITVSFLSGKIKGKQRAKTLMNIASGASDIIIGTHALYQEDVIYKNLGLSIIDEQHRFGVEQRMNLSNKGKKSDTLVMTATPIPRTLVLTAFGDLDVSIIKDKPAGRQPIETRVLSKDRIEDVVKRLTQVIKDGTKAYWICPLVEESEKLSLSAVTERVEHLKATFGERVNLVHGKMKAQEKDRIMNEFVNGNIDILVATTVVEVGVNVPEATIMVIEHAERFGLAQLHQLRGRVGRGDKASSCLLMYGLPLSNISKERLTTLKNSNDGFEIAEKDLKLRGSGDVLGIKQSGLPQYKTVDLMVHQDILETAREDAKIIVNSDPKLESRRGQAIKTLLYMQEKDLGALYFLFG